jgi:hypothetical protein
MTGEQCREARERLNWTRLDLSKATNVVPLWFIAAFEDGKATRRTSSLPTSTNCAARSKRPASSSREHDLVACVPGTFHPRRRAKDRNPLRGGTTRSRATGKESGQRILGPRDGTADGCGRSAGPSGAAILDRPSRGRFDANPPAEAPVSRQVQISFQNRKLPPQRPHLL